LRGFIQLTHLNNYQNWSKWLGIDLVNNPDIVSTDLNLSAKIACSGIKYGSFTGANNGTIDTYINADLVDYVGARKLVNGDTWKVGNRIQNDSINYFNLLTN
jgi:predicted chitinase